MSPTYPKVSICIASHNQGHLLGEAIESCLYQEYQDFEIIVLDDASTDGTLHNPALLNSKITVHRTTEPSGSGGAFNKAIAAAYGQYIVLLCADDIFTDPKVLSDIVSLFDSNPLMGHVSRYYHQFMMIDGKRVPVRAWRCNDAYELANNPSGLAFRKEAIQGCELSNKMFVEAVSLVNAMIQQRKWGVCMIAWDTVAVRIHQSTARSREYYKKMWTSSPVEEWAKAGGQALLYDFTSLIQIKNYFTTWAVIKEAANFIRLRPINILEPGFWFFLCVAVCTPRCILIHIPDIYRRTLGRWTTRELKRH